MTSNIAITDEERIKIVSLCIEYLGGHWKRVNFNDIVCRRLTTGLGNKSYYCSIKNCTNSVSRNQDEFQEVIVRLYESDLFENSVIKFSGQSAEAIIIQRLSEVGFSPKLLGVFDDGIIVEYIENKVATVEDLASLDLSKAFIRKLAFFHKQSMPISKKPNLLEKLQIIRNEVIINEEQMKQFADDYQRDIQTLLDFPLQQELEWLKLVVPIVGHKVILSHNDMNPNNILLKEKSTSIDDQIVLIDYECCTYFYRAYDIAGFLRFRNLRLKLDGNNVICHIDEYDKDKSKRELIEEYLIESKKLNNGQFEPKYDNIDHLEMEVNLFELVLDAYTAILSLSAVTTYYKLHVPLQLPLTFIETYDERKNAFLKKYGNPIEWK